MSNSFSQPGFLSPLLCHIPPRTRAFLGGSQGLPPPHPQSTSCWDSALRTCFQSNSTAPVPVQSSPGFVSRNPELLQTAGQHETKHGAWGVPKNLHQGFPGPFWSRAKPEEAQSTPCTVLGFQVVNPRAVTQPGSSPTAEV